MIPDWFPVEQFKELRPYQDFHKLAEGGFGEVFLALSTEGPVAVKRLKSSCVKDITKREGFLNEARFLKKISHPHIPRYRDGYLSETECFFIMEYFEGRSLDRLLQYAQASGFSFPVDLAIEIALQAFQILDDLHHFREDSGEENPIFHNDVKPHNLLITPDLQVVLIDFSAASHPLSGKPNPAGTFRYLAPERLAHEPPSPQTDLFALLLTFFEILTGRPLIEEKDLSRHLAKLLSEKYLEDIPEKCWPPPLEKIFLKGLAYRPEERFENAEALQAALRKCVETLALSTEKSKLKGELEKLSKIR